MQLDAFDEKYHVPMLRGDNNKTWKELILLQLGCMDFDYAIRKDEPPMPTDNSTPGVIALYEWWEQSNHMSMMYIKTLIRVSIPDCAHVRDLLKAIDDQFESSDKSLASTLMTKLLSIKFTIVKGVREHIMRIIDLADQLKALEQIDFSDAYLVHFILHSLPYQYNTFKISYNTHNDKWSINELLTMCVQVKERLLLEKSESAYMATQGKKRG
ncbi:uncharacterized protein LOC120282878 [Dioscorea cayenensis subsp. rotundata]|uniref:Uncharacterized protein LOC120282878 n=1 Tax=Dioscorea cayennensis subsp. rotundata TaxID=55577 RepID=A0AB40CZU9_DIOCR|nr:uncharacterized protein LOC120282878 [Dioscorea cayenensis subsp. rotundata]